MARREYNQQIQPLDDDRSPFQMYRLTWSNADWPGAVAKNWKVPLPAIWQPQLLHHRRFLGDDHPFTSYFGVHQGVLSHRWAIEIYYDILVSCKAPVAPCAQAAATPRVPLAFLEASEFSDSNHFQSAFCGKHVELFPQTLRWFFFSTCGCSSDWFFVLWQLLCATQLWVSNWSPNEVYQSPTHSQSYSMASRTKIRTGPEDKNISTWYPLCPES